MTVEQQHRFLALRRAVIENNFKTLNPQQKEAVLTTQGALLLLAGAGSGKTTVLIQRIANLITYGEASDSTLLPSNLTQEHLTFLEDYVAGRQLNHDYATQLCAVRPAAPWEILAITFTKKAAGELKERLSKVLGERGRDVWAFTFHSACVRILRKDIGRLNFSTNFTIYDTDDCKRVIKDCLKSLDLDEKKFPPKWILNEISKAKDQQLLAKDYAIAVEKSGDFSKEIVAKVYKKYQKILWDAGAMDFDDIILHTVRLLQEHDEVREYYQNKFKYVLIDEYQDTNHLQYLLSSLLAKDNFCVVGDDDQSIYRFRGATIENILTFEEEYKNCKVIRLEENYRSTQNILDASNQVISHNKGRKGKKLWTKTEAGAPLTLHTAPNEYEEALYIVRNMVENYNDGYNWRDHAILYRTNAQSNQLEKACKTNGVPYCIVGGTRFFDRSEVRDMIAYLTVLHNPMDDLRLTRIIGKPARGIGKTTIETLQAIALREETSIFAVIDNAVLYPELAKSLKKLQKFAALIADLVMLSDTMPLTEFYEEMLTRTGYVKMLEEKNTVEDATRLENVREVSSSIQSYITNSEEAGLTPDLFGFLDEISLFTTLDTHDDSQNFVTMMTMHGAKGLEFPVVYVAGMEEGLFPSGISKDDPTELEEERRLCYVAMTRAKQRLTLTCANQRMLFGETKSNLPSQFIKEIPEELLVRTGEERVAYVDSAPATETWHSGSFSSGSGQGQSAGTYGSFPGNSQTKKGSSLGSSSKTTPKSPKRFDSSTPSAPTKKYENYNVGDVVNHKIFGVGTVQFAKPMSNDLHLKILFEKDGEKSLLRNSVQALLTKL